MSSEHLPNSAQNLLERLATRDSTHLLSRALANGLAQRLRLQEKDGALAEGFAWQIAAACGSLEVFNCTFKLPGYDQARKSVDCWIDNELQKRALYEGSVN